MTYWIWAGKGREALSEPSLEAITPSVYGLSVKAENALPGFLSSLYHSSSAALCACVCGV